MAQAIAERSLDGDGRCERIGEIFLSPDAFAERTADASIAEQLGDGLAAAGLPRPAPADNDRVGGWMLMYQMMETGQWQISSACERLLECLPTLTRDTVPVTVDAVLFWHVHDPQQAALEVQDYDSAVARAAQTALRDLIGRTTLADLLKGLPVNGGARKTD